MHGEGSVDTKFVPTLDNQFEATITIDNVCYVGLGKTKIQAKNAASEVALRAMADQLPMMQLASFALHKLLSEWEAEGYHVPFLSSNVRSSF